MFSVCHITTPSIDVARTLSHVLVGGNKAVCVNIVPSVTSVYRWEGRVCEDTECLMMVKTRTELVQEVVETVKKNHPYSVPEVISVPIGPGNEAYLKWVGESTTPISDGGCGKE
uniref:Uncharacterized protein TCIL3000_8_8090 n=1 Tax=Trypanosoma congolense (strain IL3000) TaxID=1068625 RepID=G0UT66_TRYCI|nr:unnamed protein product [Trypanosoma congolense IL3000]